MEQRPFCGRGLGFILLRVSRLFYLLNLLLKYFCTVPVALIFLMTTHPGQFASSLNKIWGFI